MADKRLTQSPQQIRRSAQDYEKYAKGEVRTTAEPIRKSDAVNSAGGRDPWQYQGKTISDTKPSDDLTGL
jgi:hypothetical protein